MSEHKKREREGESKTGSKMLNFMSSFFQARNWQSCGRDSEVSFQNSTLSGAYKLTIHLGSLGYLKCW